MLGLDTFQFDGHFFSRCHVCTQIYITKRSAADFATQTVLLSHAELHDCQCMYLCSIVSINQTILQQRHPQWGLVNTHTQECKERLVYKVLLWFNSFYPTTLIRMRKYLQLIAAAAAALQKPCSWLAGFRTNVGLPFAVSRLSMSVETPNWLFTFILNSASVKRTTNVCISKLNKRFHWAKKKNWTIEINNICRIK